MFSSSTNMVSVNRYLDLYTNENIYFPILHVSCNTHHPVTPPFPNSVFHLSICHILPTLCQVYKLLDFTNGVCLLTK